MFSQFKATNNLEKRILESSKIKYKFQDRIPIICEHTPKDRSGIPDIDRVKYLVPNDLTMGQFIFVIRKRIKLDSAKALFLFVNNTLPSINTLVSKLYKESMDEDGFLYITYAGESTFGQGNM